MFGGAIAPPALVVYTYIMKKKPQRKKVMVNILNIGEIRAGTETDMIKWMGEYSDKYEFELFLPSARPIPNNRNQIVTRFLNGDWDILFMLDDDTYPTTNPFAILDRNVPVVGGVYPGRGSLGINFHAFDFAPNYKEKFFCKYIEPDRRKGLLKVDAVATGCMAIQRWVLEKMRSIDKYKPCFEDLFDENGELITNDDMAFCLKCKELGIEVYADWDVICDHFKTVSLLEMMRFIYNAAKTGQPVISVAAEDARFTQHQI